MRLTDLQQDAVAILVKSGGCCQGSRERIRISAWGELGVDLPTDLHEQNCCSTLWIDISSTVIAVMRCVRCALLLLVPGMANDVSWRANSQRVSISTITLHSGVEEKKQRVADGEYVWVSSGCEQLWTISCCERHLIFWQKAKCATMPDSFLFNGCIYFYTCNMNFYKQLMWFLWVFSWYS